MGPAVPSGHGCARSQSGARWTQARARRRGRSQVAPAVVLQRQGAASGDRARCRSEPEPDAARAAGVLPALPARPAARNPAPRRNRTARGRRRPHDRSGRREPFRLAGRAWRGLRVPERSRRGRQLCAAGQRAQVSQRRGRLGGGLPRTALLPRPGTPAAVEDPARLPDSFLSLQGPDAGHCTAARRLRRAGRVCRHHDRPLAGFQRHRAGRRPAPHHPARLRPAVRRSLCRMRPARPVRPGEAAMNILHPSIASIARGYALWLGRNASAPEIEAGDLLDADALSAIEADASGAGEISDFLADAIRRQVEAAPEVRSPQAGDLVLLPPPEADTKHPEPAQPVAVVLDEHDATGWHGWLVGAHVDYAGDRDLVLEAALLEEGRDPAPIAGMVMCWDRVLLNLAGPVTVLHRINEQGMQAIRALGRGDAEPASPPAPGRMCIRRAGEIQVVTGSRYLPDDPRTPYLELAQELARAVSEPENDDQGRIRRPDMDEPDR